MGVPENKLKTYQITLDGKHIEIVKAKNEQEAVMLAVRNYKERIEAGEIDGENKIEESH